MASSKKISSAERKEIFDGLMNWLLPGTGSMTEEQIYQQGKAEWTAILLQLWDAIGKTAEKKQLAVYVNELGEIPYGVLKQVVSRLLAKHTYHTVPTIGDIWWETGEVIGYGAFLDHMHTTKKLDMEGLRYRLANWCPTPRVDKYAEVEA